MKPLAPPAYDPFARDVPPTALVALALVACGAGLLAAGVLLGSGLLLAAEARGRRQALSPAPGGAPVAAPAPEARPTPPPPSERRRIELTLVIDDHAVAAVTPFDAALAAAQRRIEATVVPFGGELERRALRGQQALEDALGLEGDPRAAAVGETGRSYEADLLDALDAGRVRPEDVSGSLLPAELGRDFWSWACFAPRLEALRAERAAARAEVAALTARRDAWLRERAAGRALEARLLERITREVSR
ncbi:MAG: hypothetical protein M9894_23330 [Planctomycetes bacterium]|nr:hypothetical protein [Planctomycetota bacterium]